MHLVDDRVSDFYIKYQEKQPERYENKLNREQKELLKVNTKQFGRLVDILDVSAWYLDLLVTIEKN